MRQIGPGTIWICYTSYTNCVFHVQREVGEDREVDI